ncbi:MAG: hypothetical protein KKC19_01515 [Nanoarchaeota archaeon]|nr:hypothetical protein [Nanoarchaeota archaeon]
MGFFKKGEITTKQLVTLIVLIASFIIILFLFFQLNLGSTSNQEICHNSVVLRDTTASLAGTLDCRTEYVCVSGGGECEGLTETLTREVDASDKITVMNALAEELVNCWWMFGEGEVNYIDRGLFNDVACSICSIVGFDETLQSSKTVTYDDLYNYMRTNSTTSSQTYLQYLYGTNALEDIGTKIPIEGYLDESLNFEKTYFVLTGISQGVALSRWGSEQVPVVLLEKTPENYATVGCDKFLTKS